MWRCRKKLLCIFSSQSTLHRAFRETQRRKRKTFSKLYFSDDESLVFKSLFHGSNRIGSALPLILLSRKSRNSYVYLSTYTAGSRLQLNFSRPTLALSSINHDATQKHLVRANQTIIAICVPIKQQRVRLKIIRRIYVDVGNVRTQKKLRYLNFQQLLSTYASNSIITFFFISDAIQRVHVKIKKKRFC